MALWRTGVIMAEKNEIKDEAQKIKDQFSSASGFLTTLNLFKDIERSVNFYEGRQWAMDADISEYPKIVLNIIKQIAQVKHSGVLGNNYAFLVDSDSPDSTRKIEAFLKRLHYQMKMKRKDRKILKDVFKKGTGILYFYWDKDSRSIMSKSGGRLKAETIDIRNFRVADPEILEIQEQEWVMFATRERIDALEEQFPQFKDKFISDENENTMSTQKEPHDEDVKKQFCTVYTKFFRNEDGEVAFTKSTATVLIETSFLHPEYNGSKKEKPNSTSLQDDREKKLYKDVAFTLYPFASLVFEERDNCFYGLPAVLEYIETQKSINKHFSVYDKGLDDAVLGGYVYRNGVLGEQELTAENGQEIGLELQVGERWQDVFGKIPTNNIPSDALNYSINLLGVLRNVSGTTNVTIGQADHSGQSGKQTQMLLDRAKENTTDLAQAFNDFKVDQVEIMFMFAKFYYDNEPFVAIEHGKDSNRVLDDFRGEKSFKGTDYQKDDVMFDLQVAPSQSLSEATLTELLGLSVQSGQISIVDYIDLVPDGYFPNRVELKHKLEQGNLAIMKQMEAKLQQSEQIIQQMVSQYNKTMEEYGKKIQAVDNVIRENTALKEMLANIASNKIEKNKSEANILKDKK